MQPGRMQRRRQRYAHGIVGATLSTLVHPEEHTGAHALPNEAYLALADLS